MFRIVLLSFFLIAGFAVAGEHGPQLPKSEFITGRPATTEDISAGRAVFVVEVDGVSIGRPMNIDIPQFAYHKGEQDRQLVVIVQAEEARGQKIIGARAADGSELVGLLQEFELLGREAQ